MELKKNPKLDTFRKSHLFFLMGLVISLSVISVAFEWRTMIVKPIEVVDHISPNPEWEWSDVPVVREKVPAPPKVLSKDPVYIEKKNNEEIKTLIEDNSEKLTHETGETMKHTNIHPSVSLPLKPLDSEPVTDSFILVPEVMAEPEGGINSLNNYIRNEIKYPAKDKRLRIQGTVYLSFVVDTDGLITDVKIERGVSESIDAEALRVFKKCPLKWKPALNRHQPVKVRMTIPIKFSLRD